MYAPRKQLGRGILVALAFSLLLAAPVRAQYEQGDSRREAIEPRQLKGEVDLAGGKLDLNRATRDQIRSLPIPPEVADAIWEYRTYRSYFSSIYDLSKVEGVTPEMIKELIPLVATMPPEKQEAWVRRFDASFRAMQRFLSREGASEELADEYRDLLLEPRNINDLSIYALESYQNVSPVDATAILKARKRSGGIQNQRQLRSVDGLTYWAYRNLRDYVVYEPPAGEMKLHGGAQVQVYNTPYMLDDRDILTEDYVGAPSRDFDEGTPYGIKNLDSANPAILSKLKLRLGNQWKAGMSTFRNVGERNVAETLKGFIEWHNPRAKSYRLDKFVLGNFRIAFGQGLVMDNTDYFLSRKTGTGFNKRPRGLIGDMSRSYEFALRGAAAEAALGNLHVVGFYSNTDKDGILNLDENGNAVSINKYVVGKPRFENSEYELMNTAIRRGAFDEELYGGVLHYQFVPGTFVGISGYEARHDLPWDPKVSTLVTEVGRLEARDNELFNAYDSTQLGNFRRVLGAEFQTVISNVALAGEYAKLDSNPTGGIFSNAPDAMVFTGYTQWSNFNIFALYRDYDVGFDNPYARPFGQDNRYEQTLLGDPFRLNSPLYSWLESTTPQTKAEQGIFLQTRYRISRQLTISGLEFDQWKRKADGQSQHRYTLRLEYAPIWPLRFRLRERYSDRAPEELSDNRRFKSWDTRLELRARLSGYDELRLLYSNTNTQFAPRPRLGGPADPDGSNFTPLAQEAAPGQAIQAMLVHNVNDRLQFTFSTELYEGFLWNFEDNEFVVVDGNGMRNWFLIQSRLDDHFLVRFKMTNDRQRTRDNLEIRDYANSTPSELRAGDKRQYTAFRLQLDYNF